MIGKHAVAPAALLVALAGAADYAKQTGPKLREHLNMAQDFEKGEHVATAR